MHNKIIIIGIAGAEGTGKTTLAKMLTRRYSGQYFSAHAYFKKLFFRNKKVHPISRDEMRAFSVKVRQEAGDAAIAFKEVVNTIFDQNIPGLYVMESIQCIEEIVFLEQVCTGRATLVLIGLTAGNDRIFSWINRNKAYVQVPSLNGAIHMTKTWREESSVEFGTPNHLGCLTRIPDDHILVNDGSPKDLYDKACELIYRSL